MRTAICERCTRRGEGIRMTTQYAVVASQELVVLSPPQAYLAIVAFHTAHSSEYSTTLRLAPKLSILWHSCPRSSGAHMDTKAMKCVLVATHFQALPALRGPTAVKLSG